MTFYDTVTEMGYKVTNLGDMLDISKDDIYSEHQPLGEIHIVFYKKDKKILGYIKPLRNFFDLDDMTHIYHHLYLTMKKDLNFFAEKSKYDII